MIGYRFYNTNNAIAIKKFKLYQKANRSFFMLRKTKLETF